MFFYGELRVVRSRSHVAGCREDDDIRVSIRVDAGLVISWSKERQVIRVARPAAWTDDWSAG